MKLTNIESKLIKDIKEYSRLFPAHPRPDVRTVLDWAEMYGENNIEDGTKWARRLIEKALNGTKIEKKTRESSFVLYGQWANEMSIPLSEPRLIDIAIR